MRKKILLFALILGSVGVMAKDFAGAKIYLNPGHGGWNEMNDRHVITIPFPQYDSKGHWDTLGFWESSSNLKVAMDLREMLESRGATVKMSRLTNQSGTRDNGQLDWDGTKVNVTDAYIGDRDLSMIAREASEWGADAFVSIHTNAAGTVGRDVNYLVFFMPCDNVYKESAWTFEHYRDPQDTTLGRIMWPYLHDNDLDVWCEGGVIGGTPTKPRMPSTFDYTLLKWGNLTVPGFIVEASFHSYLPNTHRYLNRDYQYMEALRFLYAYCAYFKADFPTTCCLTGDVRCPNYKFREEHYVQYVDGSKDMYRPMNGVEVTLLQGGQPVQTYTTDNYYNGIYCFKEVTPGEYQIKFHYSNYNDTIIDVTAVAGKTICSNMLMPDPHFDPYAGKKLLEDYPTWVKNFTWQNTTKLLANTAKMDLKKTLDSRDIRRMQVLDKKIYILSEKAQIFTHATETGKKMQTLALINVAGGTKKLSDIFFGPDSMLVACNMTTMDANDASKTFRLYRWDNDDVKEPDLLFEYASEDARAGWTQAEVGRTMAVSGNSWHDFRVYYPAIDANGTIRVVGIDYNSRAKGVNVGEIEACKWMETGATTADWGESFRFAISPVNEDAIIVEGAGIQPTEYIFDWTAENGSTMEKGGQNTLVPVGNYGMSYKKYGDKILMASPSANQPGAILFDITKGLDKAEIMSQMDTTGTGVATFMQTGLIFSADSTLNVYSYAKVLGGAIYPIKNYKSTAIETIYSLDELDGDVTVYNMNGLVIFQGNIQFLSLPAGQVYVIRQGERVVKFLP